MTLTPRQKQILDFVKSYMKEKGYSPSLENIKKKFRLNSVATIHQHIKALEAKGEIQKQKNQPRSIEISKSEQLIRIKLLGTISAGQPIEAITQNETIAVPKSKLPASGDIYALKVAGDSMIDENIHDSDIILVKEQNTAENGQKVVALLDNQEATLKKFYKERGHIRLQPANKNMEPIIIKNGRDISIQGIVLDIVKNYNESNIKITNEEQTEKEVKTYKKLPLNKIILGDAVEELKKLPAESIDIVIADPPYNIGKDFGNNKDKRELNEYINWSKAWINECTRIMKPTATMFIYGFSEILAYLSVEIPLPKRWLIWHYTNKNVASLNFWQRSHESILCVWKKEPIFNKDEVREPYTEGFLNGAAGKVRAGTMGRFSRNGKETIYNAHENGALPRDVIKIPSLAGGAGINERWFLCKTCNNVFEPKKLKNHLSHEIIKHPTQKPLELSKRIIKSAIPKKDGLVLVPFVGTGSECVATKELNQNYIGFEINPDYIKIADKWLSKTKSIQKLF